MKIFVFQLARVRYICMDNVIHSSRDSVDIEIEDIELGASNQLDAESRMEDEGDVDMDPEALESDEDEAAQALLDEELDDGRRSHESLDLRS